MRIRSTLSCSGGGPCAVSKFSSTGTKDVTSDHSLPSRTVPSGATRPPQWLKSMANWVPTLTTSWTRPRLVAAVSRIVCEGAAMRRHSPRRAPPSDSSVAACAEACAAEPPELHCACRHATSCQCA
eukprot:1432250-Rhodomonas_salina.2